jgi:hypothetical protein
MAKKSNPFKVAFLKEKKEPKKMEKSEKYDGSKKAKMDMLMDKLTKSKKKVKK